MAKELALITGASAGIGQALAEVIAAEGHDLIVVARRKDRLRELAERLGERHGVVVTPLVCDLARPGAARSVFRWVRRRRLEVGLLVNNAAVMLNGDFAAVSAPAQLSMLQLNVMVPTELCHLFVARMKNRGHGRILNVASIAAFQPLARLAAYAGSKAYLLHFTEALSEELKGTGVTATALCPGFTSTDMMASVGDMSWVPPFAISSAGQVARDGYRACMSGVPVHVSGAANQMITELIRHQPRWLVRALSGWASRRYA